MLALLVAPVRAADIGDCPAGAHWLEGFHGCVDDSNRPHGSLTLDRGAIYQVSFEHGVPTGIMNLDSGAVADLSSGKLVDVQWGVQGEWAISYQWPAPDRGGLRWSLKDGGGTIIEDTWGLLARNVRKRLVSEDGREQVLYSVRKAVPDAHLRGHWTDGMYHTPFVGNWVATSPDGRVERGQWHRGHPVGRWRVTHSGIVVEAGRYRRGLPHGIWLCNDLPQQELRLFFFGGLVAIAPATDRRTESKTTFRPVEYDLQLEERGGGWMLAPAGPVSPCEAAPE